MGPAALGPCECPKEEVKISRVSNYTLKRFYTLDVLSLALTSLLQLKACLQNISAISFVQFLQRAQESPTCNQILPLVPELE